MAIVVETTSTATGAAPDVIITKPTGLAVGDLMVAILSAHGVGTSSAQSWNTAAGWTSAVGANYNSRVAFSIQYKYADSGDVAASNFTFSLSGSTLTTIRGSLLRCSGTVPSGFSPVGTTDDYTNTSASSAAFSASITPYTPGASGALIVMQIGYYDVGGGIGSVSGQAIITAGTTFTELYDVSSGTSTSAMISAAYGVQPTAVEISSYTGTFDNAKDQHFGQLAVFLPPVDASGENTLVTAASSTFSQTGTCDTIGGTNTLVTAATTALTQSGIGDIPTNWSNETKPSTTWTNPDK